MSDPGLLQRLRYLLLQVRREDDPMRGHEVRCFARALGCSIDQIRVFDLLSGVPTPRQLDQVDMALLGGSGDYSVAEGGPWLHRALETMRELVAFSKPTFASCWGFQAMARALGGEVVTDLSRAEVGTIFVSTTAAGQQDPIFGPLGKRFPAQMGHQDIVDRLPEGAVLLASSERVENQAFRLRDKPIYCTQFHSELGRDDLLQRVQAYPQYIERIVGIPFDEFVALCYESPETDSLLRRFVDYVFT